MKKKTLFLSVLIGLFAFGGVQAAEFVVPDKDNPNVSIGQAQTHRNLYTAGSNVTISSATQGDLAVAGGMVTVDGAVEQDAMLAGGTLNVNGSIGGDARVAGGNVTINGPITGDLLLGGGNVSIASRSSIGGDLVAGAGNLVVDAPVAGTARIGGGNVTINNRINGDVYVRTGERLVFGPQAVVTGTVYYKGPQEALVQPGAQVNNIQYTPYSPGERGEGRAKGWITAAFIINLLANLAVGLILLALFRGFLARLAEETFRRPWSNLGIGFAGLVLVPIVIILLLLTVIGFYAAILAGLSYALLLALANVLAGIATGFLILSWLVKPRERIVPWQAVVVGIVVWSLLRLIPVLGWIAMLVIFLMVLGTLIRWVWSRFGRRDEVPRPQ